MRSSPPYGEYRRFVIRRTTTTCFGRPSAVNARRVRAARLAPPGPPPPEESARLPSAKSPLSAQERCRNCCPIRRRSTPPTQTRASRQGTSGAVPQVSPESSLIAREPSAETHRRFEPLAAPAGRAHSQRAYLQRPAAVSSWSRQRTVRE